MPVSKPLWGGQTRLEALEKGKQDVLTRTSTVLVDNDTARIFYHIYGQLVFIELRALVSQNATYTMPFSIVRRDNQPKTGMFFGGQCLGEAYFSQGDTITINVTGQATGSLVWILAS